MMWFLIIKIVVAVLGLILAGGTVLGLFRHPHWFIRGWDFPRLQIAVLGLVIGGGYAIWLSRWTWYDWAFIGLMAAMTVYQALRMYFYCPLAPRPVKDRPKRSQVPGEAGKETEADPRSVRFVVSNVKMQNDQYGRWMEVMRGADPDVILMLEVNQAWIDNIAPLKEAFPYRVEQPQDNMYGMALLSRLPLHEPQVRFIIEEDIPSIHSDLVLASGEHFEIHGLHPKPPEPIRNQDSAPRDAELVVAGREIADGLRPAVIGGDLNDVAWSYTTHLFLKVSRMLDPRLGRGFFNSWNADNPLFRFPLDHIFHTDHFTLVDMHRLAKVGSDHFPMMCELHYEPGAQPQQPRPEKDEEDEQTAQQIIEEEKQESERQINSAKSHEDAAGNARGTSS